MAREGPSYNFDRFTVDTAERTLRCNGDVLAVPPKVFDTLAVLVENAGRVVEKEELLQRVWPDTFVEEGNLAQNIFTIRRLLGDDRNGHRYIETVPKRGYRFVAEVRPAIASGTRQRAEAARTFPRTRRRWLVAGAALAVFALAAGALLWQSWPPALDFPNRGWVLIAKFENRTGEAIFDDTVEYALERELSNSRLVNVLPPPRVQDILALMRRAPDTRLDTEMARDVALRDGEVPVVITGRVDKLGNRYQLNVALVEAATGVTLAALAEEAANQEAVLDATRTLARRVREELGEQLPQVSAPTRLEKATTPSLRALQFFSQGMRLVDLRKWNAAIPLLEQALTEDADFASAHIYLAHCYSNVRKDKEAAPHYQEAFRLAKTTSDRERYFIVGSYYDRFVADHGKALEAYEVLVRLYPDDFWGVNNLANKYWYLGRLDEALPYSLRRADLRPHDLASVFGAWDSLRRSGRDPARAEALFHKAQVLSRNPDAFPNPQLWVRVRVAGARHRAGLGDYRGALQELEGLRRSLPSYTGPRREALTDWLAAQFVHLGQLRAAEELYSALQDESDRHVGLAWVAEERGDMTALRFHLRRRFALGSVGIDPEIVRQAVLAGLLAEATAQTPDERMQNLWAPRYVRLQRAHIATAQGKSSEAIHLFTELHQDATANRNDIALAVGVALAGALERRGEPAAAAEVISRALAADSWPERVAEVRQAKFELARIYRKLGREAEASALEAEIRQSLAVAEADHSMLLALERNRQIRAAR
ncbi:MAG TPA: winged helix-turn-helix domain-containing protein [Terriglobales bacterium]|nr:winged helix-turn-helix domain-containing protein [Terriglobales bacterium]